MITSSSIQTRIPKIIVSISFLFDYGHRWIGSLAGVILCANILGDSSVLDRSGVPLKLDHITEIVVNSILELRCRHKLTVDDVRAFVILQSHLSTLVQHG